MNSLLNALKSVTKITDNPTKSTKVEKEVVGKKRAEKNPTNGADIRIMASGKVYPSQHFADKYGLEYTTRGGNTISNGVDLFRALDWPNYINAGNEQAFLLGYVIPQNNSRIELFAGVRYDPNGNPINSVMNQGSVLGDETLELIATGLSYESSNVESINEQPQTISAWRTMLGDKQYIDLKFQDAEGVFTTSDQKYYIPKATAKGDKKGEMTTVKRERLNIMLVSEWTGKHEDSTQVDQVADAQYASQTGFTDISEDGSEGVDITVDELQPKMLGEDETGKVDLLQVHEQFEDAN